MNDTKILVLDIGTPLTRLDLKNVTFRSGSRRRLISFLLCIIFIQLSFTQAIHAVLKEFKLEKISVSSVPESVLIPDFGSICIDPKGNMFAFAGKSGSRDCFIVKFDPDLKFICQFGMEGKGPGAFTTYLSSVNQRLSIASNGDLYVIDYNPTRFVVFDNSGKYKKDIFFERNELKPIGHLYNPSVVGDDYFIGFRFIEDSPPHGLICKFSPPEVLLEYPFTGKQIRFEYSSYESLYYGSKCILKTDSKHVVIGHVQDYVFSIHEPNGKLVWKKTDEKRKVRKFTAKEMDYIKKRFYSPQIGFSADRNDAMRQFNANKSLFNQVMDAIEKNKNVIMDIAISDDDVYVFLVPENISNTNFWPVELYSIKSGKLVRKGYFKEKPELIWKGNAFFYSRDNEDNPLILKYRIQ